MSDQQTQEPIRISVADAKKRYDEGNVSILDVIDTDSYNQFSYQIEGAVRIKPENIRDEFTRLAKDRPVLAY
ncbi:MAG TPA: rhodanese-like domain-containing protein [Anaerolineales bacterium]